jgi:hypothetical protein
MLCPIDSMLASLEHHVAMGFRRATQTRVLQRICFTTMESVSLLSLETDRRLRIVSLCVEGRYCSFDPSSSGFRIFPIVWTIPLFQGIVHHCSGTWTLRRLGLLCSTNAIRNGYKSRNTGSRLIKPYFAEVCENKNARCMNWMRSVFGS